MRCAVKMRNQVADGRRQDGVTSNNCTDLQIQATFDNRNNRNELCSHRMHRNLPGHQTKNIACCNN